MLDYCGVSGKITYHTANAAITALRKTKKREKSRRGGSRRFEVKHYHCEECGGYHLASADKHKHKG